MRWLSSALFGALVFSVIWGGWERRQHVSWRDYAKRLEIASRANVAALKADKAREDARRAANAQRIDHATQPARADALAGAARYAAAHRVRPAQVVATRDAIRSVPGVAPVAGSVESPAPESDLVAISRADLDACTLNSQDLGLAYEWAQGLK